MNTTDELGRALAGLEVEPPAGLLDRVVARWVRVDGPVGPVYVASTERGIAYLRTSPDPDRFADSFRSRFGRPLLPGVRPPAGLRAALSTTGSPARRPKLDLSGLSDFERDVLDATSHIPAGQIRPYAWVAAEIGRPKAVRAVGTALARNPVPLLIPCHRVTRSDGALGDYVFGASTKADLLRGEHVDVDLVRRLAGTRVHYVGSDTTGVVCFPTCADARRISEAHRVGFRSVAAAVAAGYRPCRKCRPPVQR